MKSLEERLQTRKDEYEAVVKAEHTTEEVLTKLIPFFPEDSTVSASIYKGDSFVYVSMTDVELFEESIITEISEEFNVDWQRTIYEESISHDSVIIVEREDEGDFKVYLNVRSKPTNFCRITRVPTGKTKQVAKTVYVEEAEFDYLIECSDDEETVDAS